MIFLHGFLGSPEDWRPLFQELALPARAILLPGHGGSPLPSGFDAVISTLRNEVKEPVTLAGYSLGGRLALYFALKFPELIKKLIILSANPEIDNYQERMQQDKKWSLLIEREGISNFLTAWYQQPLFHSFKNHPSFAKAHERRLKEDPHLMSRILLELSPAVQPPLWEAIQKFSFPSLFLFGDRDINYKSVRKRLMHMKGNHQAELVENSGHAIHLENPRVCAQKIRGFIYDRQTGNSVASSAPIH